MASPAGWRTLPKRPRAVLRTFPFTLGAFAVIVLVGLLSGTLWHALRDRPLLHNVAYGVPAIEHGRWWTPVTGSVYALQPSGYIAALLVFVILVGFAEWRLGTRATAIATVAIQLVVVLLTSVLFIPLRATGWNWAVDLAHRELTGFLPGAFGAFAAARHAARALALAHAGPAHRLRRAADALPRRPPRRRTAVGCRPRTVVRTASGEPSPGLRRSSSEPARMANGRRVRLRGICRDSLSADHRPQQRGPVTPTRSAQGSTGPTWSLASCCRSCSPKGYAADDASPGK